MSFSCFRPVGFMACIAVLALVSGPAPVGGQAAAGLTDLAFEQVAPVDQASLQLRITNTATGDFAANLTFTLTQAKPAALAVASTQHVSLAPGATTLVRLPPVGWSYGPARLQVQADGQATHIQTVHLGALSDFGISLTRVQWVADTQEMVTKEERAAPGVPTPAYGGGPVPLLVNGSKPPPRAVFLQAWAASDFGPVTLQVFWADSRGVVQASEGPFEHVRTENNALGPSMVPPLAASQAVIEVTFAGGAVRTQVMQVPEYNDFRPYPYAAPGSGADAVYVGILVAAGLLLGAALALAALRRDLGRRIPS